MDNISRTPANQSYWIHWYRVLLEGPNGSLIQIVYHAENENDPDLENWTRIDPGVISYAKIIEVQIPDIEPGEYNITIIINNSQDSFTNESVTQSYTSMVIIDEPPVHSMGLAEIFVIGVIIAIVSLFIYQIWRTRHDWG
jgi:hypothetical protein